MSMVDSVEIEVDPVHIPFDGYMTSHFGNRHGEWHPGVDIALRVGDSVTAAWNGVVRYAMMNRGGYGNLVIVRHRNGLETYYAHLSRIKVVSGQIVKAGDLLGLGGLEGFGRGHESCLQWHYRQ
jgi:murein DD-endopeptidase MepM/ murein hydrolase activator NlpD